MSSIFITTLLGFVSVTFIIASGLLYRSWHFQPYRRGLLLCGGALLALACATGFGLVPWLNGALPEWHDFVRGFLTLGGGMLLCLGIYSISTRTKEVEGIQKAASAELERYRTSFESGQQLLVIKDREGNYLNSNPAFNRFLGKRDQSLAGETDFKFFPRAQAGALRQEEEKVIETGMVRTRDEEIHGIDGPHWLRLTWTPLMDEKRAVNGLLFSGQDISEQKLAEKALAEWEQGLVSLADAEIAFREAADMASAFGSILGWAGKLGGTSHTGLWQVLSERSQVVLQIGNGKLRGLQGAQVKAGEDIPWKVWQTGQVARINDYPSWPSRGSWAREAGFTAVIGLPLKIKGQVTFIVTLFRDQAGEVFREDQGQLLGLLAQLASSKIQTFERFAANQNEMEDWQRKFANLQYLSRLEHVVAVTAAHFIGLDIEKVNEAILRTLQTLAKYTGVEHCYLTLFPHSGIGELKQAVRFSSWANSVEESKEDFAGEEFSWFFSRLSQMETIHIPRLTDLSTEAGAAAVYLKSRGIQSFTAVPLAYNHVLIGYLGLEALQAERELPTEALSLFKVSAEMFVNLLDRKWSAKGTRDAQERNSRQILQLEQRNQESILITEMGDLLQACRTADEAYPIITRYVQRLIQVGSGALYMIHDAKDPAESVAAWGDGQQGVIEHELVMNECWGLRRGRVYTVQDPKTESCCGHIREPLHAGYLCVPLIAQGVAVGLLHLRMPDGGAYSENLQRLALKIGEYIAMPLTNLKLRDELRSQAIRDPLTKLFNRRYMEETLEREIRRAMRHSTSVGIIMFDIDKMKPINDRLGHDAGDLVLKALGRTLLETFRGEDVACRYGGDEFTIVLPEASLAEAWRRAEQLRDAVKRLALSYDGKSLGTMTLSIGVAAFPDHGQTAEKVLLASDAASYASKSEGGNRIMMGQRVEA
jgi:diguanylate cyclase (GGDEF)-like protein/PAS domain S-box-containing protein